MLSPHGKKLMGVNNININPTFAELKERLY
jgi:hypothetical protein